MSNDILLPTPLLKGFLRRLSPAMVTAPAVSASQSPS